MRAPWRLRGGSRSAQALRLGHALAVVPWLFGGAADAGLAFPGSGPTRGGLESHGPDALEPLSTVRAQRRGDARPTGWRIGREVRPGIGLAAASGLVLLGLRALLTPRRELAFMVTTEEEAIRGLRAAAPGLLITTPQLAGGSGLSLLQRVRSSRGDTRTILLVGHRDGDLRAAGESAADAALLEEECFGDGQVLAALSQALSRGQRFRSAALIASLETALPPSPAGRDGLPSLNRRELELVDLLVRGLGDRQIAEHLAIQYETARGRTKALRRKLGVSSRAELVAKALRHGLSASRTMVEGQRSKLAETAPRSTTREL